MSSISSPRNTTSIGRACTCTARIRQDRALHLGAKYPERFAALVISSGPIVSDTYPFDRVKGNWSLLVIHGDQDTSNPIEASKKMADAARAAGVDTTYATVPGGTHLEAYLTYASSIFDFLDSRK
jgi:pimeloyl-ACP methyl ester carboxylesterase